MSRIILLLLAAQICGCKTSATGNSTDLLTEEGATPRLFADLSLEDFAAATLSPPKFIIEGPIQELMDDPSFTAERPATFVFPGGKRAAITLKIRGATSRFACQFKKLDFAFVTPDDAIGTGLEGSDEVNIGTHCEFPEGAFDDVRLGDSRAVAREVLAYRLVEISTNVSRRARLVEVEYKDQVLGTSETHPAFFLEDTKAMRKRTNTKKHVDQGTLRYKDLTVQSATSAILAEALIGNTDWQLAEVLPTLVNTVQTQLWNFKVVADQQGQPIAVPYDFDIARIVSGISVTADPQAFHKKYFKQRSANFRQISTYLTHFNALFDDDVQDAAAAQFRARKPEILQTIASAALDDVGRALAKEQANDFFAVLDATRGLFRIEASNTDVFANQGMTQKLCSVFFPGTPIIVLNDATTATAVKFQLVQDMPNDPLPSGGLPCEAIPSSDLVKKSKTLWTRRASVLGSKNP